MQKILDKKFSRRSFINLSAKILAAPAIFNFFPGSAHARRTENKILLPQFKTLEEMDIRKVNLKFGEMDLRPYTGAIIVHHYGLPAGDVDKSVAEIHRLHVEKNHWSGIGYHFVVHKDGSIEYARPLEFMGAHASKNNEFTVGVALAGNYDIGQPPPQQLQSAVQLIGALCDKYNFPPTDTTILGHRDVGKTTCPGHNLYPLLPEIIQSTQTIIDSSKGSLLE